MNTEYDFNHKYRGHAVIIVNKHFDEISQLSKRNGANTDLKKMKDLFQHLDFFVTCYKDLTGKAMLEKIRRACTDKKNKESDCFVLVLSSHGEEEHDTKELSKQYAREADVWRHFVFGTDGVSVYVDEIMSMFESKNGNAIGLQGKPKLFFIQVCSFGHDDDDGYDYGSTMHVIEKLESQPGEPIPQPAGLPSDGPLMNSAHPEVQRKESVNNKKTQLYASWKQDPDAVNIEELSESEGENEDELDAKGPSTNPPGTPGTNLTETPGTILAETPGTNLAETPDTNLAETPGTNFAKTLSTLRAETPGTNDLHSTNVLESTNTNQETDARLVVASQSSTDSSAGVSQSNMPALPFDVTPVHCPKDCLIMYPVRPHKSSFRSSKFGSWLLHYLHADIKGPMPKGEVSLLMWLTRVAASMATFEHEFDGLDSLNHIPICDDCLEPSAQPSTCQSAICLFPVLEQSKKKEVSVVLSNTQLCDLRSRKDWIAIQRSLPRYWSETQVRNMPVMMCSTIVHRLLANVCFKSKAPKAPKTFKDRLRGSVRNVTKHLKF